MIKLPHRKPNTTSGIENVEDLVNLAYRYARRVVILIIGGSFIIIGGFMIFLPGPATLMIPAGIGILAIEFAWARRWLHRIRDKFHEAQDSLTKKERDSHE